METRGMQSPPHSNSPVRRQKSMPIPPERCSRDWEPSGGAPKELARWHLVSFAGNGSSGLAGSRDLNTQPRRAPRLLRDRN